MLNLIILGEIKYLANMQIYTPNNSSEIKAPCNAFHLSESTVAGIFSEIHIPLATVTLCLNGQSPQWFNHLLTFCIHHTPG